ncbi:hypothetical protein KIW84_053095 [Lathyrus oleraceus]|uniref:Uncharacterized protein n=1 Tax=Pisum sativum TaxID=3888 RepID=A0A9D4WS73_PEA|nr:hypothetical protein KIW84_053095 [Pisum sativum]
MAKQRVVIKLTMENQKSRSSAMKVVIGVCAIRGDYKDEIEVTGERIDSVKLTRLLRKKFCYADLVSDSDLGKKEEKKEEAIVAWLNYVPLKLTRLLRKKFCYADLASVSDVEKKEEAIVAWPNYVNCVPHYNYPVCEIIRNSYQYEDPCNCCESFSLGNIENCETFSFLAQYRCERQTTYLSKILR